MKTDKELRKIAKDIYNNLIFFTTKQSTIKECFPILLFVDKFQIPHDIGSAYEYYDKASPRSINGKPMFFSINFLTSMETKKVVFYLKEMKELLAAFEDEEDEEETLDVGTSAIRGLKEAVAHEKGEITAKTNKVKTQEMTEEELEEAVQVVLMKLVERGDLEANEKGEVEVPEDLLEEIITQLLSGEIVEEETEEVAKVEKKSKRAKKTSTPKTKKKK